MRLLSMTPLCVLAVTATLTFAGCNDSSEPTTDGQTSMSTSESESAIKTEKPVESSPAEKMLARSKGAKEGLSVSGVKTEAQAAPKRKTEVKAKTELTPEAPKVIAKTVLAEAIASAKSSDKSVLVHFSADW